MRPLTWILSKWMYNLNTKGSMNRRTNLDFLAVVLMSLVDSFKIPISEVDVVSKDCDGKGVSDGVLFIIMEETVYMIKVHIGVAKGEQRETK